MLDVCPVLRYTAKNGRAYNDIAIVKLGEDMEPNQELRICSRQGRMSNDLVLCGMGTTQSGYNPIKLQEAELHEWDSDCDTDFDRETQICASGLPGKYACYGDSGGPLFAVNAANAALCVYGIVSFGDEHCDGDDIFTRVSYYKNWIQSNTAETVKFYE